MKIEKDESLDDYSTIKKNNNFLISETKNYKITIISFLIIITIINSYVNNKFSKLKKTLDSIIKKQDDSLKKISEETSLLKRQIEAFFLYLHNFKNKSSIYQLLKPKGVFGKKKIRIGSLKDGGYVLLDDFENIKFAYSFGISNEISFDKDLADKNIDIYMYDHTINKLPFLHKKFHWKKIGITEKKRKF